MTASTRPDDARPPAPRVCMFVYNNCAADARVLKEAASLMRAGHHVQVVAVLDRNTTAEEHRQGLRILRIDRNPPHYRLLRGTRRGRRWVRLRRHAARRRLRRERAALRRLPRRVAGWARHPRVPSVRLRLPERPPAAPPSVRLSAGRGGRGGVLSAVPARLGRAARWRILRLVPPLRRHYYRRRSRPVSRRRLAEYRKSAEAAREERGRITPALAGSVAISASLPEPQPAVARLRASVAPTAIPAVAPVAERAEAAAEAAARADALKAQAPRPPVVGADEVNPTPAAGGVRAAQPGRPGLVKRLDQRVSRIAYRTVMVFHKPLMYVDFYVRAYRAVSRDGFDVFHAHDLNTLPVAAALALRRGRRLVFDAHELYSEVSTLSRRERLVWRLAERLLIRRADRVLTVCESIADELVARHRIARPAILLNCPPRAMVPSEHDRDRLRGRAGLAGSDEPIVLYQGGFARHRGLPELIEASRYLERGVVVLMGWGALEPELARLIVERGLEHRVRIVGPAPQSELLTYTQGADVGVIPYRPVGLNNYYTTPNKMFEYIAAGVPIAGSRLPELRRFVEGEGLGVTFDPARPEDMGLALNFLIMSPGVLAEMRARALQVRARFAWEAQEATLLDVYDRSAA